MGAAAVDVCRADALVTDETTNLDVFAKLSDGFLNSLVAVVAIGIGNVWKFPWMTGQYGGGAFVLIYLLFLLVLGVPVLTEQEFLAMLQDAPVEQGTT